MRTNVARLTEEVLSNSPLVFFDVETTGFGANKSEIIQISAKHDSQVFNCFVKPKRGIKPKISELTGITMVRGRLHHNNVPVASKDLAAALIDFVQFLTFLGQGRVILVAHNATFDMRFLIQALGEAALVDEFRKVCAGFVDTLSLSRKLVPKSEHGPEDNTMNGLLKFYFGEVLLVLHDSANDVLALESIFQCLTEDMQEVMPHSFEMNEYIKYRQNLGRAKGMLIFSTSQISQTKNISCVHSRSMLVFETKIWFYYLLKFSSGMTVLLNCGLNSGQVSAIAASFDLQGLYSLSKLGLQLFNCELTKLMPSMKFSNAHIENIFKFLVGTQK
jgi:DNA polymerase III alpha subunit (gram-positive type)